MSPTTSGTLLAIIAVALFSTSAVLVRISEPVSSAEVTFWRMLIAGGCVLAAALMTGQLASLGRPNPRFLVYGLIAALHFLAYIASLSFTTVASSLALVYTAPIFVAIFSALFLKERVSRRQAAGIAIVVLGVALLSGLDLSLSRRKAVGDGLALLSAAAFGLYSVAGRDARRRYPLLVYAGGTYLTAALWLAPPTLAAFDLTAYEPSQILAIVALAVLPLALGHTLYNAALRRIHAARANVLSSLEIVGGSLLVWLIRGEPVRAETVPGIVVILVGVLMVIVQRSPPVQ